MTYLISDIHGDARRFLDMLAQIRFSQDDSLYILGDAIDRGEDGIAVLDYIRTQGNMTMLCGNHEDMMLQVFNRRESLRSDMPEIWMENGGKPTRDAFLALPQERQVVLLDWLANLPDMLELCIDGEHHYYLVHASPASNRFDRLWTRINPIFFAPVPGKTVIFGHTPGCYMHMVMDKYLRKCGAHINIEKGRGWIDIDCGCGMKNLRQGCLGCLRLDDMAEFYSTM